MGEAKRRQLLRDRVLAEFPFCIYCGGMVPATSVDHCPARCIFDGSHRPSGLEFPACDACNQGGRLDELAAAMLSRIYPDPKTEDAKREVARFIREANNNWPRLLEEMRPSFRQSKIARRISQGGIAGALNCQGPLLNCALHRFGAKLAYALHFELVGRPVPPTGAATTWWFTNERAIQGKMPTDLMELLGETKTLQQGQWEVGDQFSYRSRGTDDGTMSAHFATFRFSFAICAFVADHGDKVQVPPGVEHMKVATPGWLRSRPRQNFGATVRSK